MGDLHLGLLECLTRGVGEACMWWWGGRERRRCRALGEGWRLAWWRWQVVPGVGRLDGRGVMEREWDGRWRGRVREV